MLIKPIGNRQDQTTFGYSHYLKTMYKKGLLPSVQKDLYGSPLNPRIVSLEHLLPHSKGGKNTLQNYALATIKNNNDRGSEDLGQHLDITSAREYLDQFRNVSVSYKDNKGRVDFSGNRYIEMIKSTLKKLGVNLDK